MFILLCAAAVFAVAAISAFVAQRFRAAPAIETTDFAAVTDVPPETVAVIQTLPPVTTVASTVTTEEIFAPIEPQNIREFTAYATDTPEYQLANLLLHKVPTVRKTKTVASTNGTAEGTETVSYNTAGSVALYYKDLTDGQTLVFAPEKTFFGASMIKAVYMFALLQIADRGEADLDEVLVYTKDMYVSGSGNFQNVKSGSKFTVRELISKAMRRSDNTAYSMVQRRFGTDFFAAIMEENGLAPTHYGAWWRGTAEQYGAFFAVLYGYLTSESENGRWLAEEMVNSTQTVMLPNALAPEKVAHKYGWDKNSYCDGAIVLHETHPYVVVFLSDLDRGSWEQVNTNFIHKVGGYVKQIHDAKYADETQAVTE